LVERTDVVWVGSSRKDLKKFPKEVRGEICFALEDVQEGLKPGNATTLQGFGGASVLEIKADAEDGNTYRAVYTVKFSERIYVLHCFNKKSTQGIKTSQRDIDMINQRFRLAEEIHKKWLQEEQAQESSRTQPPQKPKTFAPRRKKK
jgi:phage-related protein